MMSHTIFGTFLCYENKTSEMTTTTKNFMLNLDLHGYPIFYWLNLETETYERWKRFHRAGAI